MSSKKKNRKRNQAQLRITIERDVENPPIVPKGIYKIRTFANNHELQKPLTGLNTFEEAMRSAIQIKEVLELNLHRKFPMSCIQVLDSVLPLIDKDSTLKHCITEGGIAPTNETFNVTLKS
mgnify:CR=1 FL=1